MSSLLQKKKGVGRNRKKLKKQQWEEKTKMRRKRGKTALPACKKGAAQKRKLERGKNQENMGNKQESEWQERAWKLHPGQRDRKNEGSAQKGSRKGKEGRLTWGGRTATRPGVGKEQVEEGFDPDGRGEITSRDGEAKETQKVRGTCSELARKLPFFQGGGTKKDRGRKHIVWGGGETLTGPEPAKKKSEGAERHSKNQSGRGEGCHCSTQKEQKGEAANTARGLPILLGAKR